MKTSGKGAKMIYQLTLFLPNEPGCLARASSMLGDHGIQVYAIMVSSMNEAAIVRLICDDPEKASQLLSEQGYHTIVTRVLALEVLNKPGGLARLLQRLASVDLNVEYVYCCTLPGSAVDIIAVSGDPVDIKLNQAGIVGLSQDELVELGRAT